MEYWKFWFIKFRIKLLYLLLPVNCFKRNENMTFSRDCRPVEYPNVVLPWFLITDYTYLKSFLHQYNRFPIYIHLATRNFKPSTGQAPGSGSAYFYKNIFSYIFSYITKGCCWFYLVKVMIVTKFSSSYTDRPNVYRSTTFDNRTMPYWS